MDEEESIAILCPVCSQPMDASEEVAECVNPTCAVYELETGTWYAITRHIETMQSRLTALEAVAQQANHGMVTDAEWVALSPESRHRLNVYALKSETLAGLLLSYVTADGMRPTTPGRAITHMRELAVDLAPQPVADAPEYIGGSGYVSLDGGVNIHAVEGVTVAGKYAELPLAPGVYEIDPDANQNAHFKRVDFS